MSAILDSTSFDPTTALSEAAAAPRPVLPVLAALLGGLLVGSLAFSVNLLARPGPSGSLAVTVGGVALTVPREVLRAPAEGRSGATTRLDLRLSWPDMKPLAAAAAGRTADEVLVSLVEADDSPAPETRMATLYARFLEPQVQEGPGDLITRHFKKASPYAGEVLVFSPPDGRLIAARCEAGPARVAQAAEATPRSEVPASCLAEIRRGGIDLQLRFEPRVAAGLEAARQNLLALVERMAR